ncbi:MAG TPA: dihydrofolate reductase family protein [Geminicoccaceae bacterium]
MSAGRRPRFRVYIAQSLDGFIASPDGTIDWLEPFPAGTFGFESFIENIATIVMGRASYDQVLTFGDWPYAGTPTVVLTSRPFEPPRADVEVWTGSLPELIEELGQRQVGEVWVMGGAATIGAFVDLGRIDRLDVFILPLLLGRGVPLHTATEPRALSLRAAETLEHGVVRLEYACL